MGPPALAPAPALLAPVAHLAGGAGGPPVLILHATGFNAAAYTPLAAELAARGFSCFGLDVPGHGAAAGDPADAADAAAVAATSTSAAVAAEYLAAAVGAAGLRGCCCLGHSAGGAYALLAAAAHPGLFRAVYAFEAVAAAPATSAAMGAAKAAGRAGTAGGTLSSLARRRRSAWPSEGEALASLARKPPFSGMHPEAVQLYVRHGTRPVGGGGVRRGQQQQPGQQQQQPQRQPGQQQQQQPRQQQQPGGVELACSPAVEAAYYLSLDPPPAVDPAALAGCAVLVATAAPAGGPGAAGDFSTHAAVLRWLEAQQAPGQGAGQGGGAGRQLDPLHGVLYVVNSELAAAVPGARREEVEGTTHFGPLERPARVAASAAAFFLGAGGSRGGARGGGLGSSKL